MGIGILSAIQFSPRLATCSADVSDNFRRAEPLMDEAAKRRTSFLVFPELCMTGYTFLNRDQASAVAERFDGPTFDRMSSLARDIDSYVSWGYVEVGEDDRLYNSATMVNPDGEMVTSTRKINLYSTDFLWATPGIEPARVVDTEFGRTSIIICRDIRDQIPANIPRTASDRPMFLGEKLQLVAACTNWGSGGGYPPTTFMDFVADNQCTMVVADRWGKEKNEGLSSEFGSGKTVIISADWRVHTGGMIHGQDCVVSQALNFVSPVPLWTSVFILMSSTNSMSVRIYLFALETRLTTCSGVLVLPDFQENAYWTK